VKTYAAPSYYQPVAAIVQQPDVFVVQNNYPQPLAQQGQTVYSYQSAAQVYSVNPAEVLRQAADLSRAATATAQIGLQGFNDTARTQLTLQASISEPLARGHAAAQILTAAGLANAGYNQQQQSSLALRIYQEQGQWKVEQQPAAEINARLEASTNDLPPPRQDRSNVSLVAQKCAKCHGRDKTAPKGELYLDAGLAISCETLREAIKRIKSADPKYRMPPDGQLSAAEAGGLLDELLELSAPAAPEPEPLIPEAPK
jgi:hypothetical protein